MQVSAFALRCNSETIELISSGFPPRQITVSPPPPPSAIICDLLRGPPDLPIEYPRTKQLERNISVIVDFSI